MEATIVIAKFGRAHGTRGEVRLWPYNAESPLYERGKLRGWARDASGGLREVVLSGFRWSDRFVIVRVAGVSSREEADALVNQELVVSRAELPALTEDELYLVDTIGWPAFVRHEGGLWRVGEIEGYAETGAQEIMRVKLVDGGAWLVPMLDHCLEELAPERARVVLAPLEVWAMEGTVLPDGAVREEEAAVDGGAP